MGMTDRQFDSYQANLLELLKQALEITPENEKLKALVKRIEAELKRP
ncbi:MAG: hypothetical protein FWG44_02300 [Oscillospiraceae bacterium]|nr:hypothetical protein [Oscillospiraceae bacterium]